MQKTAFTDILKQMVLLMPKVKKFSITTIHKTTAIAFTTDLALFKTKNADYLRIIVRNQDEVEGLNEIADLDEFTDEKGDISAESIITYLKDSLEIFEMNKNSLADDNDDFSDQMGCLSSFVAMFSDSNFESALTTK